MSKRQLDLNRGEVLHAIVKVEDWELLDLLLDAIPTDCAEDGTPEGLQQAAWIGFHLGFLQTTPKARERESFVRLIERYQAQLDLHLPGMDAKKILRLDGDSDREEQK